jgi:FMN reductase
MKILGIVGSPQPGGRTLAATRVLLRGAATGGCDVDELELANKPATEEVIERMDGADAFVFASPVYRARAAFPLKHLLDATPRGMWGETVAPLQGKACAIVLTGASLHHFLAVDDLRSVLSGFFAVQVLSPGLYLPAEAFVDRDTLDEENRVLAEQHGRALAAFAQAVRASGEISSLRPLA